MHIQKNIYVYVDLRMCAQKIIERYIIWENMAANLFAKFNSKNIVKQYGKWNFNIINKHTDHKFYFWSENK